MLLRFIQEVEGSMTVMAMKSCISPFSVYSGKNMGTAFRFRQLGKVWQDISVEGFVYTYFHFSSTEVRLLVTSDMHGACLGSLLFAVLGISSTTD